jgi:DNA-binding NtrC family response regulator
VLQSGEYRKVGSNKIEHTDVRIVAATNVNLYEAVRRGKFREDLYFRLSAAQIRIPALRDRQDDIYLLFRKFTSDFSDTTGMCKIALKPDAIRMLCSYRWPGNVRQLMGFTQALTAQVSQRVTPTRTRIELSAAELAPFMPVEEGEPIPVVFDTAASQTSSGGPVGVDMQAVVKAIFDLNRRIDDLEDRLERRSLPAPALPAPVQEAEWQGVEFAAPSGRIVESAPVEPVPQEEGAPILSVKEQEAELIRKALEKHNGNRKLAAAELGMSERTLYRKLPPEYRRR